VTVTVDANGRVTSLTESAIVATDSTKLPLAGGTMTGTLVLRTGSNTAGTAPVKFVSGFLLTSPEAGAVEFLNDDLLLTITTGTARKRLALCDASLTSGKMPYATTNGRLTDASTLYWDAANSRLGIGPSAPVAKLDVGTNFRFVVYPDYAGLGDIGASSTLIGSYAGDLAFFAETGSGTTGKKTIFAYFNGTTVKSAMEVANTTGGTTSTLELMKGGGNVNVGASASVAARNAVTVKNTSANAAAEAGFYATSEVGNAFFGMTSNASSRTVAGLVISAEAGSTFPMTFWTNGSRRMTITGADGYLALNRSTATARLHIAAGSASATTAPLKFDSGTLMSTPETGAVEFLTDDLLFTITTGSARKRIALCDAALTSGRVTFATTNGRLSDSANLTFTSPDLFLSAASGTRSLYFGSSTSYNSLTSLNDGSLDLYFGTTATNRGYRFSWQTDRNVVLYSGATPIWTTGTATSDRRLKDNIQPTATPGIDTIKQLEVVDFNWKAGSDLDDGGKLHTGLIAQDVAEIIPDAVKDSGGTLLLHKEELVPVLLKALQEAVARIEVLEQALAQKGGQ
jgi:hypothetical protein